MRLDELFHDWEDIVEYPRRTVIFSERDSADVMYVVMSGEAELTLRDEPIGAECEGGMLGEMAMITSGRRTATATTSTKVKLARVNRDQFRKLVDENTDFAFHVMSVLANRLSSLHDYYTTQFAQFSKH